MKRLFLGSFLLLCLSALAAPPVPYYVGKFAGDGLALSNVTAVALSSNTINLASSPSVGITTNSAVLNTPYLTASQTNSWRIDATNAAAGSAKIAMNGGAGTNIVLEGLTTATNLTVTKLYDTSGVASTIAAFNAGTNLYSVANGAGFLENDGGGAFTWVTSLNASNLSGNVPNGSIPGWVASGADVVNATNSNALHMNATNLLNNLQIGNFNAGTSASSSTFWRGDGTWATPAGSSGANATNLWSTNSIVMTAPTNSGSSGQVLSYVDAQHTKWIAAAGGGDVLAAGQNNFSGSNYFGGRTFFVSTMDIQGALRIADGSAIITNGAIAGNIRVMSGTINDLGTGVLPVPSNAPTANKVLTATSASTAAWGTASAGDVTQSGQNNFSGSNYFGGNTTFNGTSAFSTLNIGTGIVTNLYANGTGISNVCPSNIISGTLSSAILSSATSALSGPAENELPTAQWVRSLFNNGIIDYTSTNIMAGATNTDLIGGAPIYTFQSTIPISDARVYSGATVVTNNAYIGGVMTTNQFTFIQGPIDVNAFIGQNGSANESVSIHPEIYYSYDKTNWLGDWTASAHTLTHAATNLHQWVISFPAVTSTNSTGFYVQRRFKVDTATGTTPSVVFVIGTNAASGINNASHIALSGPSSAAGNAYLANNQTFTGNNTFTAGTRTFSHDTTHTLITNTATLTSSEWTAGSQKEWYNGNVTMTIDKTNGTITAKGNLGLSVLGITIDGGGSAITSGAKGFIEVPTGCTIKSGTLLADQNGSIQIEAWRTNDSNLSLISRSGALGTNFLTSTNFSRDGTLSGWTGTTLAANDVIEFYVTTNASAIQRITYQLKVQK